jgi:hypothetical protein
MYRELELECNWHLVKEEVGDDLTPGVPEHVVIEGVYIVDEEGNWLISSNIIDAFTHEQLQDMAEEIYADEVMKQIRENYG